MKKLLILAILLVVLLVAVAPVSAGTQEAEGCTPGDGETGTPPCGSPGWSIQNPGQGGSDSPGPGPGEPS